MKRFTLILALVLMAAMPSFAEHVSSVTAQKAAATFLNNNGAKSSQITDLSKAVGFPNLYIFTTEQSFVVMSADDCVQPVLGYSLTGSFAADDMPDNVRGWLQGYNEEIQFAMDNKMSATAETAQLWKALVEGKDNVAKAATVVNPLIETKWNQNKYYNNLCPQVSDGPEGHAYTGCVATAMAQIMKYWEYPSHGIGSHSYTWNNQTLNANFGETTYDWDNMVDYYYYYYSTGTGNPTWLGNPTTEQIDAVATLMYHCGVSVEMSYGGNSTGGSSAVTSHVVNALKTYFNYSPDMVYRTKSSYESSWIAMVKAELDANRPLQYRGRSSGGGHSFICDGYNSNNYFHFNWGWSGAYDGYFSLDNLNTGANNQSGQGNGVYTDDQAAIFGIQPVQCLASEPTNLTYSLSGLQNLTLNWTAASGAASYNIYCNNNLVGNSTTNTYTGIAPFGTNSYYVRSVDANGVLSLTSNVVTFTVAYQTPIVDDLEATLSGNNVNLSWEAPEWCYPETPSVTLNYGTENVYYLWSSVYYAHRHLAANLAQYAGKAVYKVSTFIQYPGTYSVYIYTSTQSNQPNPSSLAFSNTGISVTTSNDWYEFITDEPIILTGTDDLWVVIKQENTGQACPTPSFNLSEHNTNAFYSGSSPTYLHDANSNYNCAWFINTYLTDGTYTYNLYDGTSSIASNISGTTYSVNNIANNTAHQYTIKTNYYAGESNPSNMVGFTKGNASLNSLDLGENDKMTVTENSKLTVSGTVSNTNVEHLILEDGAQLIHNSNGVKATVKKNIVPYTADNNGWYFIASPVLENITPSTANGLLNGIYDLYYYDEPTYYWMNYRNNAFDLTYKQGYLYASDANTPLQFAGTLAPSNNSVNINGLSYSSTLLKGFNLVGNPFACNATVDQDCYIIDNTEGIVILAEQTPIIAPCEGVFVKATASDNSVTFTKSTGSKVTKADNCLDLVITQGRSTADRARLRFGDGIGMEKYSMDDKHSQISLWQNGQDLAVAYANEGNEMPLNFKAAKNGTYTLSIEAEELGLGYLHLIDNLTGNDVDLLATPSYTFEAKTTDYASRFKLVFEDNNGPSTGSESFAYISDGTIIINNEGGATLQIVDMTGRVVFEGDAMNRISTSEMTSGVYVLRLINGEKVRTQKIVIE